MADFLDQTFVSPIIFTCVALLYGNKKICVYKLFFVTYYTTARSCTDGGMKRSFINHSKNHF